MAVENEVVEVEQEVLAPRLDAAEHLSVEALDTRRPAAGIANPSA